MEHTLVQLARVGIRVEMARQDPPLRATELARRLGWTVKYLTVRINGKAEISLSDLEAIAHELGVDPRDLIAQPLSAAA
jgi:transcriptional regulator with XRE-family HTH domain